MKLAILDFDYTLYDGRSRYDLGYAMEKAGIIGKGLTKELKELEDLYLEGKIGYNDMYRDDKAIFAKYYKDVPRTQIMQFLDQEFDMQSKLYQWGKDLIALLRENGYLTVLVSGSWDFIIEKSQELLDFDSFFASEFEIVNGNLSNEYKYIFDHVKKRSVTKQLIESSDYSLGVGDSVADLVFLKEVDLGFAYNPRKDMLEEIEGTDIMVVDDKNVIELVKEAV